MKVKEKTKRRVGFVLLMVFIVICLSLIINFIPTLKLQTAKMSGLKGDWIDVYYEKESAAAEDTFNYADSETERIARKLGFTEKPPVKVYIYDLQKTMQTKKYGLIGPMLNLDWYIGDNIGTNVILTSPANPGPAHTYDDNKYAVLHEIVHAYISVMNPKIRLWLTEGCALYLANGNAIDDEDLPYMQIPSFEDTRTKSPIRFADCGGYSFAYEYISFLDKEYGWEKVVELLKTEDYVKVIGKSEHEIYDDWVESLNNRVNRNYNML